VELHANRSSSCSGADCCEGGARSVVAGFCSWPCGGQAARGDAAHSRSSGLIKQALVVAPHAAYPPVVLRSPGCGSAAAAGDLSQSCGGQVAGGRIAHLISLSRMLVGLFAAALPMVHCISG
jgi:hypothetical protein